jgi:hypothetical protein
MGFNNNIFPITAYEIDENNSFAHIRSYITLYYYIITVIRDRYLEKNKKDLLTIDIDNKKYIKKLFELCYKNIKYFNFFYKTFFEDKNILLLSYN